MDLTILDDYVNNGLLRRADSAELCQYNYTERTNNEGTWDDITIFNRGNIYEKSTGNLVAKSMPKFLNFSELPQDTQLQLLQQSFSCTEKLDGCMGILYDYHGLKYNGRGSFEGFVVDAISDILPKYNIRELENTVSWCSLIVEVIHPTTKIIVNYGNMKELVLITGYRKDNGSEIDRKLLEMIASNIGMPIVRQRYFTWDSILNWAETAGHDEEGFVLTFDYDNKLNSYIRCKIKSLEYLKVAAFRRNLNKHTVWKLWKNDLKQRSTIDHMQEYIQSAPDELYKTALRYVNELKQDMEQQKKLAYVEYENTKDLDNKSLGILYKNNKTKYAGAVWAIRKGYDIESNLIEFIEPEIGFEDIDKMLEE